MTISYASEVPNGSSFGCFWRILIKWKGSVYKMIWRELLVYLIMYYIINLSYRYTMNDEQRKIFERIRYYFANSTDTIPLSFVLAFYVGLVVKRWWEQYKLLPWPDNLALFISAAIPGNDERGRLMRRNIVRYAVLAYVITLQRISLRVKKRFPTLQHVVDVGLMMESEKKIFEMMNKKAAMSKYWMPLVWATNIINRARKEALITSDHVVQTLLVELSDIRKKLGGLIGYDTVCVPLVYTQVVTLSLYAYFFAALLGRQFVYQQTEGTGSSGAKYESPDMYFPFFTVLQFGFYVGWLKVAEVLINPFGEDDDDIELNWLIDRHIKAGYMIVDEMHEEHPELLKDQYWDEVIPKDLPYTVGSEQFKREEPKGSAEHYKVKETDALYANVLIGTSQNHNSNRTRLNQEDYADYESVDTPIPDRRKNWLQRTITRMGSIRSSSTTYSSGGLFSRNRHNSVYSQPDQIIIGGGPNLPGLPSQKNSFYDRLRRKSIQGHRMARQSRLNSIPNALKNRPRIPTPDVAKELPVIDRDQKIALSATNAASIGAGIIGMIPPPSYIQQPVPLNDGQPFLQVLLSNAAAPATSGIVLSPIQEKTEGSTPLPKKSNISYQESPVAAAATAQFAQSILGPTLPAAGFMTPLQYATFTAPITHITTTTTTVKTYASNTPTTIPIKHILQKPPPTNSPVDVDITELNSEDEVISKQHPIISLPDDQETPYYLKTSNLAREASQATLETVLDPDERAEVADRPEWSYVFNHNNAAKGLITPDPKGKRSASLPCPPAQVIIQLQKRDDRSRSLPSSAKLNKQSVSSNDISNIKRESDSSKRSDTLKVPETSSGNESDDSGRPRSGSLYGRPRSDTNDYERSSAITQDVVRKISSNSNPNKSIILASTGPPAFIAAATAGTAATGKRSEVYV